MTRNVEWRLVVDETGAVKKMEEVGKEADKTDKSFEKTKRQAKDTESSIKGLGGAFGGLKGMIGLAAGALGGLGLLAGAQSILSTTSELAEETEKFHAVTGMGAQSSLDYTAALKARGIGTEAVVKGYKALGKAVQTAERQEYSFTTAQEKAHAKGQTYTSQLGVQAQAFQKLGINFAQFKALSPERQFEVVTTKLEGMRAGLEKTTLASTIFGRGGTSLLPVLEKGSLSLNHFRTMAERFFPTLRGEGVRSLEQLQEKQAESKLAWEGLEFTLGMKVAPAFSSALGSFSELVSEAERGKGPFAEVARTLEHLGKDAGSAFNFIKSIAGALGIKLSGNTLGAVLAAAATVKGIKIATKPVKAAVSTGKTLVNAAKKFGPWVAANPELTIPAAAALTGWLAAPALTGPEDPAAYRRANQQLTEARNRRALVHQVSVDQANPPQGEQLRELAAIRDAILQLHQHGESGQQIIGSLHMDSTKVGEVIALNPKAMRFLAEAVERNGNFRNARR